MFLDAIIISFFVIIIGCVLQKRIGFNQKTLSNVLIYVTAPALVLFSLYSTKFVFEEIFFLILAVFLITFFSGAFAFLGFRFFNYKKTGMLLPAMFMNSSYLGYPIALFALGEIGLQKAIIFDSVSAIIFATIGIFLVQNNALRKRERIVGIFKLPLIYAIFLGIFLNLFSISIPEIGLETLSLIGSATIPLALLTLGGSLATLKIGSLKIPLVAVFSRIVIGGLTGFLFVKLMNLSGVVASIILIISIMPPAVNSYIFNEKFSDEGKEAATAVVIGTLLCIIPLIIILSGL